MAEFTTKEMMDYVLLSDNWYEGYCGKKTAATIRHRHSKGILTIETYEKVFNHFGFKKNLTWDNRIE